MGSAGGKRKGRRHLPKVRTDEYPVGTVRLGEDPGFGPLGPMSHIEAIGKVTRAWNAGTRRQRRAALMFLVMFGLPFVVAGAAVIVSRIR